MLPSNAHARFRGVANCRFVDTLGTDREGHSKAAGSTQDLQSDNFQLPRNRLQGQVESTRDDVAVLLNIEPERNQYVGAPKIRQRAPILAWAANQIAET